MGRKKGANEEKSRERKKETQVAKSEVERKTVRERE